MYVHSLTILHYIVQGRFNMIHSMRLEVYKYCTNEQGAKTTDNQCMNQPNPGDVRVCV